MSDSGMASAAPEVDRRDFVRNLRRVNEQQHDDLVDSFDASWGEIEDDHRAFVERFLSELPAGGRVLDAPCGTGKYFSMVLESGRSVLGVDHSGVLLARARSKLGAVPTERRDLQDLPYHGEFDGVMCVDSMEMIPPEDWPVVLNRFRRALRQEGWLYLTIELHPEDWVRRHNEETRRSGLPVVDGEVIWHPEDWKRAADEGHAPDSGSFYHYFPRMEQVRAWITDARFAIEEEAEGPWHNDNYAYHHVLARVEIAPQRT